MSRNALTQGERVTIRFDGTLAAHSTTTSTNAGQVTLYDANSVIRVLQLYERLVIDTLQMDTGGEVTQGNLYLITGANTTNAEPALATILAEFSGAVGTFDSIGQPYQPVNFTQTGRDVPLGVTPFIFSKVAWNPLIFTGDGRIVATTQPGRPNWRENLTAGGNF